MAAKVTIKVLHAHEGDCILITISDKEKVYNIMVDSGVKSTYQYADRKKRIQDGPLKCKVNELRGKRQIIDLVILSHVDEDHIGGIVEWIAKDDAALNMMATIWLNNGEKVAIPNYSSLLHTIPKGRDLDRLLRDANKNVVNLVVKGQVFGIPYGYITILSPTVVAHNVIVEQWNGKVQNKTPDDYGKPIKDLLDYEFGEEDASKTVKLAHHGSRNNFSEHFLDLVKADVFIFSSNGNYYGHPDKEVFARIIDKTNAKVYFNYKDRAQKIICEQDVKDYPDILNRILDNLNG